MKFIQQFVSKYANSDKSNQDISFYYNEDGTSAILLSIFCKPEIIYKIVSKRNEIQTIYYDPAVYYILLENTPKKEQQNFESMQKQFESNQLPFEVFISSKFDMQKAILTKICLVNKLQLKTFPLIKNRRLRNDLLELFECLDENLEFSDYSYSSDHCFAYYTQSKNLNQLEGLIIGPKGTPYEGIAYTVNITIPDSYPVQPPKVTFNEQILHPNISEEGEICLNILQDQWNSVLTIQKVLVSIVSLLYEKNLEDVYNPFAKYLYEKNPEEYRNKIRKEAILSKCQNVKVDLKSIQKNISIHHDYDYSDGDDYQDDYDS